MNQQLITNDHFQPETFLSFVNGKKEIMWSTLKELSTVLVEDSLQIQKAIEEKKPEQLRSIAHRIKPNFFLLGMNEVGNLCKELETVELNDEGLDKINILLKKVPSVVQEIEVFTIDKLYFQL
ncbi:MAG: Hpt domain [Bacteroidota bacterium]|jgi:HPt (histidine-containing phosphotransfer) domain-containing protein